MLETMWILLLVLAILFMILAVGFDDNPFINLVCATLSIPLWFILGLTQMELEQSYTAFNASSGQIESGITTVTSDISPFLTYIFMVVGFLMMIYLLAMVFDHWYNYKNWHGDD